MNTIKPYLGIKPVAMISLLLFIAISSGLLFSCKKETVSYENYTLSIQNKYFEKLDTVQLSTQLFLNLDTNKSTTSFVLPKGNYNLHCVTYSKLVIDARLNIKGSYPTMAIIIQPNGSILLE